MKRLLESVELCLIESSNSGSIFTVSHKSYIFISETKIILFLINKIICRCGASGKCETSKTILYRKYAWKNGSLKAIFVSDFMTSKFILTIQNVCFVCAWLTSYISEIIIKKKYINNLIFVVSGIKIKFVPLGYFNE